MVAVKNPTYVGPNPPTTPVPGYVKGDASYPKVPAAELAEESAPAPVPEPAPDPAPAPTPEE